MPRDRCFGGWTRVPIVYLWPAHALTTKRANTQPCACAVGQLIGLTYTARTTAYRVEPERRTTAPPHHRPLDQDAERGMAVGLRARGRAPLIPIAADRAAIARAAHGCRKPRHLRSYSLPRLSFG